MGFVNKVRQARIDIRYQSGQPDQLIVSSSDVDWATHYACYLQVNGETVVTYGYRHQREFHFDLSAYSINDQIKVRYYFYNRAEDVRGGKSVDVTAERLRLWILMAEEDKLSNLKLSQLGKLLVEQRQLQLGPFPQYSITADFNFWEQDPFNNRSWQWRLHWFEFINQLLPYYHQSKEQSALALAQKSIESWWDSYWGKPSKFEFIRHDHATALRAEVLLTYYCYVAEYVPDYFLSQKLFFKKLHQFLLELKAQLLDPGFYSEHTNHGLEQARVLLLLGVYFQDQKAQEIAVGRISSELEFSFTEEGVHKENSPGYHQFVLKVFLNIIARFPKEILGDLATRFDEIGTKALSFLTHIIRPDGYLPIIGDTESIRPSDGYKTYFKDDVAYQEYLYSASLGKRGQKPSETFKVYEESGYAIYRNHWGDRNDFTQSVQLILKAGCLSRYHHQQDEGNVLLYAYGEDWLIDSGLYNYINADPIRKYMRSRHAHNVPIISNSQYDRDFKHRVHNWQLSSTEDNHKLRIEAAHQVLSGVDCKRSIIFENHTSNKELFDFCIEDTIKSLDKKNRDIALYWHIPRDKSISIEDDKSITISSITSQYLLKLSLSEAADKVYVIQGIQDKKVSSCVSKKFGVIEDSYCLAIHYSGKEHFFIRFQFKNIKGVDI